MKDYRVWLKKYFPRFYEWARKYRKPALAKYVYHRNITNKGVSEIYILKQLLQYVFMTSVVFTYFKIITDPTALAIANVILGICFVVFCWGVGKLWDMANGYEIESAWGNARNTLTKDIRKHFGIENEDEKEAKKVIIRD